MQLEPLYKRNVNGSINQWIIFIEDNLYWTEFGLIDGKRTQSELVSVEGKNIGKKNETTPSEQAYKEALSIWKKKIKSENFVTSVDDIDKKLFEPPMLAKEYDGVYDKTICYCQPKLDGIRCNMFLEDGEVKAISRKNNPFYTVKHIQNSLKEILQSNPTIHLDGELYNHLLHDDFNKVVSLVKKEKLDNEDYEEVEKYVRYNIYDMWDEKNPNMTFSERNSLINKLFVDVPYVDIVSTYNVNNQADIEDCFNMFVGNGYEGAI